MQTAIAAPQNWQEILAEKDRQIAQLELRLQAAEHNLAQLLKLFKGSKTERFVPSAEQLSIFEDMAPAPSAEPLSQTITRKIPHKKDKQQPIRKLLPPQLPRQTTTIEPEGIDLETATKIGQEITEVLEYKPGKFFVNQIIRPKYKINENIENGLERVDIQIASIPTTLQPIAKSNVGPGLLAHILICKYEDHLPLYRQRKIFLREKVNIPESTIGNWTRQGLNLLIPLYENLLTSIKKASYLMADESPIAVLESAKPGATHKGYYWVYYDPISQLLVFQYHKSRSGDAPREFLAGFSGYLQTDGYAGYDQFEVNEEIVQLACMAHVRRKFFEALQNDKVRAEQALTYIGKLYDIEREAKESKMSHEQRQQLRTNQAAPIMVEMEKWLLKESKSDMLAPKSITRKAISYTLNLWDRLKNYLADGKLEIDNNWIENKIRPLAIGRKNYLFAGSHESAQRAAMIYSLLAMCRLEAINPQEWLADVLSRIQDQHINKIQDLLPKNWKANQAINDIPDL